MSDNDSIKAADITTANFTTHLVAEWIWDGPVVLRVGRRTTARTVLCLIRPWTASRVREILAVRVWWA